MESVSDRQERVIGWNQEQARLSHVLVVGTGGIGSKAATTLVQQGYGSLTLIDPDRVEPSNLSRQEFSPDDVGEYKSLALARRLVHFGAQGTTLLAYPCDFSEYVRKITLVPTVLFVGVDHDSVRVDASRMASTWHRPMICVGISRDAGSAYVFVQEPGHACLGCFLGSSVTARRRQCPRTPAIADVLHVIVGFAVYALSTVLMTRVRSWNALQVFMESGATQANVMKPSKTCLICNGRGAL